jgi:fatty-acyl-CoA synthase
VSLSETTVVDRFAESLERSPGATAVHLVSQGGDTQELSYEDLHATARRAARGLASLGIRRGDVVLLLLPTCREMLGLYLASLYTGVIPLIQPEPRAVQTTGLFAEHVQRLAACAGARHVLALPAVCEGLRHTLEECAVDALGLFDQGEADLAPVTGPEDVAHLQATSGSTGEPKVAVVRNRNVSANVRAIGEAIHQRPGDRVVSWLPLYHDMGLICISCTLYWQRPLVLTDAANFVRHPIQYWLQLISSFQGTISPAPTSAYQVCARLARRRRFDLDLSRWRVAFCGAEPVHPRTLAEFQEAFAPCGLPETTLLPVYGLAESTLAVTVPSQGSRPGLDIVDGALLETEHRAVPAGPGARPITLVCVGRALAGHQVRVTDADGRPLPDRHVGEIEALGPSVVDEYRGGDSDGLKRPDGYLRTGDLGYLDGGDLYVTGRKKDILILHGRNLLPSPLEALVAEVVANGIHNGTAAVGLWNEEIATEELHVIVESRQVPPPDREELEERVRNALRETFEVTGIYIHWVRKGEIPKTTSGKIRRSLCQEIAREQRELARTA